MFKVFLVAIINGILLGLLVFGAIYLINLDIKLAIVVSLALFSVVLAASFL